MKPLFTACSLVALLTLVSACCSCSKSPEPQPTGGTVKTAAKNPDGTIQKNADGTPVMIEEKLPMTEEEWKKKLTPEQYRVLREHGTERAFTGKYDKTFEDGTYTCAGCGEVLFLSDSKFDSGCGWPAFSKAGTEAGITEISDDSYGMTRVEVRCTKCGGHLGHVFDDGPAPTGRRYCINSASIDFTKKK